MYTFFFQTEKNDNFSIFSWFFLVHLEEKYIKIKNYFDFLTSDKKYGLHLSRQSTPAVARRVTKLSINPPF